MRKPFLKIGIKDAIKGVVVSIFSTIVASLVTSINSGALPSNMHDVKPILLSGAAAGLGYLGKNILENSDGEFLKKEK